MLLDYNYKCIHVFTDAAAGKGGALYSAGYLNL